MTNRDNEISRRKSDHIKIVLDGDVGFSPLTAGFERLRFEHCALPEINYADIDLSATLFDRPLNAPFLISSMTGGPAHADTINRNLAIAAESLGIGLAVGSQRIALENHGAAGISKSLRKVAPTIPLIGNLGAAQIVGAQGFDRACRAIDMIAADGLFIHLNPLQEAIQSGGDRDWRHVLPAIERLAREGLPIAVKEVGFGLSASVVRALFDAGVAVIDVAGAGGTNWARVEGRREAEATFGRAEVFADWGIPTAKAICDARAAAPSATIIGSGGIATGLDAAKAIRLGADVIGQAGGTLHAALEGPESVIDHFDMLIETLKTVCFCTGSRNLNVLKAAPIQQG